MSKKDRSATTEPRPPIRHEPLPLEFPGLHYLDEQEIEAVVRVLRRRSPFRYYGINSPMEVSAFESEFADFLGVSHALGVNSGTAALHVALAALGTGPGQEMIVPAYMWASVAAAVVNLGAIPVLADIDDTFCLDPQDVSEAHHLQNDRDHRRAYEWRAGRRAGFAPNRPREKALPARGLRAVRRRKHRRQENWNVWRYGRLQLSDQQEYDEWGGWLCRHQRSHLHNRAFACHDTGYMRDENGREVFDDQPLYLWGHGCRLDELRGAILRVQLSKLPRIVAQMRRSKYRIRQALEMFPQIQLRRIVDPTGDTGSFLICTFNDEAPPGARAKDFARKGLRLGPKA